MKSRYIRPLAIFLVAMMLILATLFSGENVILSDNGDYGRVTPLTSLYRAEDGDYRISLGSENHIVNLLHILFDIDNLSSYPSSQIIPVRISVAFNLVYNLITGGATDIYNIYFLGLFYSFIYALALTFALLQIKIKNKYVYSAVAVIALILMCDIGYVSYFNSLYGEGFQHILFVVLLGFFLRILHKNPGVWSIACFYIFLLLYGTSKSFCIPAAVIFGIIYLVLILKHKADKKRLITASVSLGISTLLLLFSMMIIPKWISEQTNYNAVFFGIIHNAEEEQARESLLDLGLDAELSTLADTHFYVSNTEQIQQNYDLSGVRELSSVKLALYYFTHPVFTLKKLPHIAEHSGVLRNIFFMDSDYMENGLRLTLWSRVREKVGFDTLFLNIIIIIGFFALAIFIMARKKDKPWLMGTLLFLILAAIGYAFLMPYAANGDADLAKHMFLFVELIDALLLGIIILGAASIRRAALVYGSLSAVLLVMGILTIGRTPEKISFGGIQWLVIEENDEYKTLISAESIGKRRFDDDSNLYTESEIRQWLSDEFYESFSQAEKDQLCSIRHKIILSREHKHLATEGDRDFYCLPYASLVNESADRAYKTEVSDIVMLPSADHIALMAQKGYKIGIGEDFWLENAYFNSGKRGRFMDSDGMVYIADVTKELSVRAVICIKNNND